MTPEEATRALHAVGLHDVIIEKVGIGHVYDNFETYPVVVAGQKPSTTAFYHSRNPGAGEYNNTLLVTRYDTHNVICLRYSS